MRTSAAIRETPRTLEGSDRSEQQRRAGLLPAQTNLAWQRHIGTGLRLPSAHRRAGKSAKTKGQELLAVQRSPASSAELWGLPSSHAKHACICSGRAPGPIICKKAQGQEEAGQFWAITERRDA